MLSWIRSILAIMIPWMVSGIPASRFSDTTSTWRRRTAIFFLSSSVLMISWTKNGFPSERWRMRASTSGGTLSTPSRARMSLEASALLNRFRSISSPSSIRSLACAYSSRNVRTNNASTTDVVRENMYSSSSWENRSIQWRSSRMNAALRRRANALRNVRTAWNTRCFRTVSSTCASCSYRSESSVPRYGSCSSMPSDVAAWWSRCRTSPSLASSVTFKMDFSSDVQRKYGVFVSKLEHAPSKQAIPVAYACFTSSAFRRDFPTPASPRMKRRTWLRRSTCASAVFTASSSRSRPTNASCVSCFLISPSVRSPLSL